MFEKKWDLKTLRAGLVGVSYLFGAVLKNSARTSSIAKPPGLRGACDTYVSLPGIPAFYSSYHLRTNDWPVISTRSLLASVLFFVLGVLFLRK